MIHTLLEILAFAFPLYVLWELGRAPTPAELAAHRQELNARYARRDAWQRIENRRAIAAYRRHCQQTSKRPE